MSLMTLGRMMQPTTSGKAMMAKIAKLSMTWMGLICFNAKRKCGCKSPAIAIVMAT